MRFAWGRHLGFRSQAIDQALTFPRTAGIPDRNIHAGREQRAAMSCCSRTIAAPGECSIRCPAAALQRRAAVAEQNRADSRQRLSYMRLF